jgi:toxin ParE1/3/4
MIQREARSIRWRKAAVDDLAGILEHIADDSPKAAQRFFDEIMNRIESLARFPFSGEVCPHDRKGKVRQIFYGNYIVYYSVSRKEILIRAVVHGARLFRAAWLRRR